MSAEILTLHFYTAQTYEQKLEQLKLDLQSFQQEVTMLRNQVRRLILENLRLKRAGKNRRKPISFDELQVSSRYKSKTLASYICFFFNYVTIIFILILGIFSKPQLNSLLGNKRVRWTSTDISKALGIAVISKKAFETIRNVWGIPLPAPRTLRRWGSNFKCQPGILHEVLTIMESEAMNLDCFQDFAFWNLMKWVWLQRFPETRQPTPSWIYIAKYRSQWRRGSAQNGTSQSFSIMTQPWPVDSWVT